MLLQFLTPILLWQHHIIFRPFCQFNLAAPTKKTVSPEQIEPHSLYHSRASPLYLLICAKAHIKRIISPTIYRGLLLSAGKIRSAVSAPLKPLRGYRFYVSKVPDYEISKQNNSQNRIRNSKKTEHDLRSSFVMPVQPYQRQGNRTQTQQSNYDTKRLIIPF